MTITNKNKNCPNADRDACGKKRGIGGKEGESDCELFYLTAASRTHFEGGKKKKKKTIPRPKLSLDEGRQKRKKEKVCYRRSKGKSGCACQITEIWRGKYCSAIC